MKADKALAAIIAMLFLSLLVPSGSAAIAASVHTMGGERTLSSGEYAVLAHFSALEGCAVQYSFEEGEGKAVDLILLDVASYHLYRAWGNVTCIPGSALNAWSWNGSLIALQAGQEYYLVADNTGMPYGGAVPRGPASISYSIGLSNAEPIEGDAGWALPLIVASIAALVLIVAYFLVRQRKGRELREPGTSSLEMRHCPGCGAPMAMFDHTCPKCGKRS